jgi:hypothetical protein
MKRTVNGKSCERGDAHGPKRNNTSKRSKATKGAPFEVDAFNDGDIVSPRRDLSEDEIKEQEDRRS